jgi:hypothetical protein
MIYFIVVQHSQKYCEKQDEKRKRKTKRHDGGGKRKYEKTKSGKEICTQNDGK